MTVAEPGMMAHDFEPLISALGRPRQADVWEAYTGSSRPARAAK